MIGFLSVFSASCRCHSPAPLPLAANHLSTSAELRALLTPPVQLFYQPKRLYLNIENHPILQSSSNLHLCYRFDLSLNFKVSAASNSITSHFALFAVNDTFQDGCSARSMTCCCPFLPCLGY